VYLWHRPGARAFLGSIEEVRRIRDEIEKRVRKIAQEEGLGTGP